MAIAMTQLGGIGVIHKNLDIEEQAAQVRRVKKFESGMVVNPLTIYPDQTLADARALMATHNISGFPVIERGTGRLVGILTHRDVRFATDPTTKIYELMTRDNLAIVSATVCAGSVAKRTSRWVRMPTSRPLPRSTTGKPLMLCVAIIARASARVWSGWMVSGSTTMPLSNFFTLRTCAACCSTVKFLWITPMPPACAIAIAIDASVTVSIAAETSGMFSQISRVSRVAVRTDAGRTCE